MALRLKKLVSRRSRAARVLAAGASDTVHYWSLPDDHSLELALFLQFHDKDNQRLEGRLARLRIAYRNYTPYAVSLTRSYTAESAGLSAHDDPRRLLLVQGRTEKRFYIEKVDADSVDVLSADDGAVIGAAITIESPPLANYEDVDVFRVTLPDSGGEVQCSCCSEYFPT